MSEHFNLNRRELLRNILVLAGAAATANFSLSALAEIAQGSDKFLNAESLTILSAVADTIIPVTDTPGALAADVPSRFDALLLNWAAPETQEMIVGALARINAAAQSATGKSFESLSAAERKTFLIEHDKAALVPVPLPEGTYKGNPFAPRVSVVDIGYHRLKGLIVSLYYVSEVALTQELVYEHVPGKWVPSLKITPGMRAFASTGPF